MLRLLLLMIAIPTNLCLAYCDLQNLMLSFYACPPYFSILFSVSLFDYIEKFAFVPKSVEEWRTQGKRAGILDFQSVF